MKVLVIERNRELRQHVVNTLRSADFQVEEVQTEWEILDRMQSGRMILVVGMQEQEILSADEVRQRLAENPSVYLILLLEAGSQMDQVKNGLRNGADDFVFQSANDAELILRVGIAERILNLKSLSHELPTTLSAPKFHKTKTPSPNVRV